MKTRVHSSMGEKFFQIVKQKNKYGLINSNNEIVIPLIYDEVKSSDHWQYFIIRQNGKLGLIHVNGTLIKEPKYDSIELRKEYLVLKRRNQKDEFYSYEY